MDSIISTKNDRHTIRTISTHKTLVLYIEKERHSPRDGGVFHCTRIAKNIIKTRKQSK